jgi:DNA-binding transcriptional LysR family regulator
MKRVPPPSGEAVDLELLSLFDHLLRERHVTRAALRVGLSQPAMSRALVKLRETFADPLFVRGPRGVTPTARAEALAPAVRDLLDRARALLRPVAFDPVRVDRTFVIGATDYVEVELLPRLAKRLAKDAPSASVSIRPFSADSISDLGAGRLDLVITAKASLSNDLYAQTIREEAFGCAVRKDHPTARRKLSVDEYAALSHVLVAPRGDPGSPVDTELAKLGKRRHVAVRTVSFFGACRTVASTDLIVTSPQHVLEGLASAFGLRVFAPPVRLPAVVLQQVWHARAHTDPAHAWFRGVLHASARA